MPDKSDWDVPLIGIKSDWMEGFEYNFQFSGIFLDPNLMKVFTSLFGVFVWEGVENLQKQKFWDNALLL